MTAGADEGGRAGSRRPGGYILAAFIGMQVSHVPTRPILVIIDIYYIFQRYLKSSPFNTRLPSTFPSSSCSRRPLPWASSF
jgi:hypothetical protein